jgi:hypothetical protein
MALTKKAKKSGLTPIMTVDAVKKGQKTVFSFSNGDFR